MNIHFSCPKCRGHISPAGPLPLTRTVCPHCNTSVELPAPFVESGLDVISLRGLGISLEDPAAIDPPERPAWNRAERGLGVEGLMTFFALGGVVTILPYICCLAWLYAHITLGPPDAPGLEWVKIILFVGALLWVGGFLTGRSRCAAAPVAWARTLALGSAAAALLTPLAVLLVNLPRFAEVLPASRGWLVGIAGAVTSELLYVLYLRAVALRFADTAHAQRLIGYLAIALLLSSGVYVIGVFLSSAAHGNSPSWLPGEAAAGFGWWVALGLLGLRMHLVRRTRDLIACAPIRIRESD